jgi:putative ABC transport system permease protein
MIRRPPLLRRLLSSLLRGPDADILRGDIEESFRRRAGNDNPRAGAWAGLSYLVDVLRSVVAWWSPNAVRRRARARSGIQLAYRRQEAMGIGRSLSDVWYAGRSLVRRPAFTIVAVLTLGLGIGSAVTIYSVVDAVVVRPLPYEGAARLVRVGITFPDQEWDDRYADLQHLASVSGANFQDWRESARSFAKLAAVEESAVLLPDTGQGTELVTMARATENFFELLSGTPFIGRSFLSEDLAPEAETVVILSHRTWLKRYGGDPSVVGELMPTAGRPYSIIGVLPVDFRSPEALLDDGPEFWMPLDLDHGRYRGRGTRRLNVLGRLRPGVSVGAARDEIDAIQESLAEEFPDGTVYPAGIRRFGAGVNTLHAETVGTSRRTLLIFFGASGLLLLISDLNAANLLLVRGMDREGELGVRQALGAGRGRLVRALLAESVILAAGGGVLGVLFSYVGIGAFLRFGPSSLPRLGEVAVNSRILAISAIASLAAGVLVGIIPAFRLTGRNLVMKIREASGTTVAQKGARIRTVMVAAQLVLGVGASLLFNSFIRVRAVDPGFRPDQLTVFAMPMKRPGGRDQAMWQDWDELLNHVRTIPGNDSADAGSNLSF